MPGQSVFTGIQYRLRASSPMPIYTGDFVLHAFGAEVNEVDIYNCTTDLPASSEFRGQGLSGDLISASFSRIGDKSGIYFQGREVHAPTYTEEDDFNLL